MEIEIYREGALSMSICAPKDTSQQSIIEQAEAQNPSGTKNGWMISEHKKFACGSPIPCQCEDDPKRQHWLLEV